MSESSTRHGIEFHIDEETRDGGVVLALEGDADLNVADELRQRMFAAIDSGAALVVLDLSGVTFLDSSALGTLVGGAKRARTSGVVLRLVVPRAELRRIFEVTLLDRVLPLDATRDDALAASPGGS